MKVRYQINDGESDQLAHAHIKASELRVGDYRIHLGGDLNEQDRIHKRYPEYLKDKRPLKWPSVGDFLESFCECLITHEVIHLVIFDLTKKIGTVKDFDNIDEKDEICGVDFWSSEL